MESLLQDYIDKQLEIKATKSRHADNKRILYATEEFVAAGP